jgi:hypothetical protein
MPRRKVIKVISLNPDEHSDVDEPKQKPKRKRAPRTAKVDNTASNDMDQTAQQPTPQQPSTDPPVVNNMVEPVQSGSAAKQELSLSEQVVPQSSTPGAADTQIVAKPARRAVKKSVIHSDTADLKKIEAALRVKVEKEILEKQRRQREQDEEFKRRVRSIVQEERRSGYRGTVGGRRPSKLDFQSPPPQRTSRKRLPEPESSDYDSGSEDEESAEEQDSVHSNENYGQGKPQLYNMIFKC